MTDDQAIELIRRALEEHRRRIAETPLRADDEPDHARAAESDD